MAYIEYIQTEREDRPSSVERIEVRPWALGGKSDQMFAIGSGANFDATGNIWLEIIYSVGGVQFFYTRNFLHSMVTPESGASLQQALDQFQLGEYDSYGFGDVLPETSISLKREKYTGTDEHDQETTSEYYHFEISADVGAVIGAASPGMRMIKIRLEYISFEAGLQFMQDLNREIMDVYHGKHPNPARLPVESSNWSFMRQLNQKAYNLAATDYQEEYFSNPLLTEMFDTWLVQLPVGGRVLDAGCGHGDPVISRLLEKGFQVTGTDLSPRMLERARENFPTVTFVNQMVSELTSVETYDGICSLSSLLYLDPIDLAHSLHRLYQALKPGGLLFLYAYDLEPSERGFPYHLDLKQWMWAWTYGMDEAVTALEEFGFFKVLQVQDVSTETQKQERLERWRKQVQESRDRLVQSLPSGANVPPLDLSRSPQNLPYCYAIIARRGYRVRNTVIDLCLN